MPGSGSSSGLNPPPPPDELPPTEGKQGLFVACRVMEDEMGFSWVWTPEQMSLLSHALILVENKDLFLYLCDIYSKA